MKTLYKTIYDLKLGNMYADLIVQTDGNLLYVTLNPVYKQDTLNSEEFFEISANVTYNGTTKSLSSSPAVKKRVTFTYADSIKCVSLTASSVTYGGTYDSASNTFSWSGSYNDPDPEVTISVSGARAGTNVTASYSFSNTGSYQVCLLGVRYMNYVSSNSRWQSSIKLMNKNTSPSYSMKINSTTSAGTRIMFEYTFACYMSSDDLKEDYIGLYVYTTPEKIVSAATYPFVPDEIKYGRPRRLKPLTVTWSAVVDSAYPATNGYELQKAENGISFFETVYTGAATTFTETISQYTTSVAYRVRALGASKNSLWRTGSFFDRSTTNVYIAVGGEIKEAEGIYIGVNGAVTEAEPVFEVGESEI